MTKKLNFTIYALYFSALFWIVSSGLYIVGISGGKVGITCMAISCLIAYLFYKQHERFMDNSEQWKLALHCIGAVLYNAWLPLSLVYFLVLDEDKQQLFISLFHPNVLPTAFVSITAVSVFAFFGIWFSFKGYTYLIKRDIKNKKG